MTYKERQVGVTHDQFCDKDTLPVIFLGKEICTSDTHLHTHTSTLTGGAQCTHETQNTILNHMQAAMATS